MEILRSEADKMSVADVAKKSAISEQTIYRALRRDGHR